MIEDPRINYTYRRGTDYQFFIGNLYTIICQQIGVEEAKCVYMRTAQVHQNHSFYPMNLSRVGPVGQFSLQKKNGSIPLNGNLYRKRMTRSGEFTQFTKHLKQNKFNQKHCNNLLDSRQYKILITGSLSLDTTFTIIVPLQDPA